MLVGHHSLILLHDFINHFFSCLLILIIVLLLIVIIHMLMLPAGLEAMGASMRGRVVAHKSTLKMGD